MPADRPAVCDRDGRTANRSAADCDRGEWAFRDGKPCTLGEPVLVHYDALYKRPYPHFVED